MRCLRKGFEKGVRVRFATLARPSVFYVNAWSCECPNTRNASAPGTSGASAAGTSGPGCEDCPLERPDVRIAAM